MTKFLRVKHINTHGSCSDVLINLAKISMIQPYASGLHTNIWMGNGNGDDYCLTIEIPFEDISKAIMDNNNSATIINISEL